MTRCIEVDDALLRGWPLPQPDGGAGKLIVATPASAHAIVAAGLPEARVIALPEAAGGAPREESTELLRPFAAGTAALLAGPGMMHGDALLAFVRALLPLFAHAAVLLDARAMDAVRALRRFERPVLLTPHAGEMAHLTGLVKDAVCDEPLAIAQQQAREWNAVIALKGAAARRAPRHARLPGA